MASTVRNTLLCVVLLVASTAAAATGPRQSAIDEAALVSGAALALESVAVAVPTREQALGLDGEMRAFVAQLAALRAPEARLAGLVNGMAARGLFSLEYAEVTRTAAATFHERQGNCLSFTMLFVALARAAGLSAVYQAVEVPPTWSNDGRVVIANHVNALVRTGVGEQTIVDFNQRDYEGRRPSRRVDDDYILALFHTNLGAEALLRGEHAVALAYLREAARVRPDLAGAWVNLGVLYSRSRLYDHAEAAYLRALEADPYEPSALANLVAVYAAIDEPELAADYRKRVQRYRERNPYYHFAVAERAYDDRQPLVALAAVRRALKLKRDEATFHALQGAALRELGRTREAEQSFVRARAHAAAEEARRRARVPFDPVALSAP
jgi:tetratricopeptide (TPR) repeat protein